MTRIFSRISLIVCLSLLFNQQAFAESSVWRIEKDDKFLYLGGTVHILTANDYPLPEEYEQAYQQSSMLVFETDLEKAQDPEFQQSLIGKVMLTDGSNLLDYLGDSTQQSLREFCQSRQLPLEGITGFKVGMASFMLTIVELQRLGLVGTGVDEYFLGRATGDRKNVGHLESMGEQIDLIAELGVGREDELIMYTLNDINSLESMMTEMIAAWRSGDAEAINELTLQPMKKDFPDAYQSMFVNRNNNWLPKIEALLATSEIEFVLVGAAHMPGEEGLLAQLVKRGFSVQKL